MKLILTCVLATAFLTFLSGCVTEVESRTSSLGEIKTYDPKKHR